MLYHIFDFKRSSRTLDTKSVGLGDTDNYKCLEQREGKRKYFFPVSLPKMQQQAPLKLCNNPILA